MSKLPISLIIDDGGVVNTSFFHDLAHRHELLIPPAFTRHFGQVCARHGVRGKFSVVPLPCGLGRLDEKNRVNMVPAAMIDTFVRYAKEYIAPRFSVTPELLTHYLAWDLERGGKLHYLEDTYISGLTAEEIARYISLGLTILDNIGLTPTGVSSPWNTGIDNEKNYAQGIGMAFRQTFGRDRCFYFLHSRDELKRPVLMCDSPATGRVVSIPNLTCDPFWQTQNPADDEQAWNNARQGVDALLSEDGRGGALRELFDAGLPLIMITHWQSLYSDGRAIGLAWFERLLERIGRIFGKQVEWLDFDEMASGALR